ncbi:MAG: ABC transporter substrate-binding protein [Deltaproteobacteria bacterium]|nr:ABC transporter substrate-binding protein [Deltaproteobacteria bacterium]
MSSVLGPTLAVLIASAAFAEQGVTGEGIVVGMVNAQTGPASALGKNMRVGAEALFKGVNEKGGVHGRKIELLVADDGYEPDKCVDQTVEMIEGKKVFALVGYVGTPTGNAALPVVKEYKVPLVGLFSGGMAFRQPVTSEVFNLRASYDDEAEKLVELFVAEGAKKIAVFYQDDGFGLAVLSGTEKALKKRGMEVVAKGTFQRNTTAVKTGLASVLAAKPDAVIMVGPYTPLATFVKEARAEGLKARLATVSFVGTDSLVGLVGTEGDGIVISQVVPFPGDLSVGIVKECAETIAKASPGEKLGFVNLEGCLTAKTLVLGLEKAGQDLTRAGLIKALEGVQGVDLGGLTLTFGPQDHQGSDHVFLTQIKDGKITPLTRP